MRDDGEVDESTATGIHLVALVVAAGTGGGFCEVGVPTGFGVVIGAFTYLAVVAAFAAVYSWAEGRRAGRAEADEKKES